MKNIAFPRVRRTAAILFSGLTMMTSILVLTPSTANATLVDPPSGMNWQWHTKQFDTPYGYCTGKLGVDRRDGYVYTKVETVCSSRVYALGLELYVTRAGVNLGGNPEYKVCNSMLSVYSCSFVHRWLNPAGSQDWYIASKNMVNENGNTIWVPRFSPTSGNATW